MADAGSNSNESHPPGTELSGLDPDSHTAQRLKHANPEHLHLTTRRCFIGPIPEGWLKSHRRDWYKRQLGLSDTTSRRPSFTAGNKVSKQKRLTGLDGPSAAAVYGHSFRQPSDLDIAEGDEAEDAETGPPIATTKSPPAIETVRSISQAPLASKEQLGEGRLLLGEGSRTNEASTDAIRSRSSEVSPDGSESRYESAASAVRTASEPSTSQKHDDVGAGIRPLSSVTEAHTIETRSGSKLSGESGNGELQPSTAERRGATSSTTSLVQHDQPEKKDTGERHLASSTSTRLKSMAGLDLQNQKSTEEDIPGISDTIQPITSRKSRGQSLGAVRFNVSDHLAKNELQIKARIAQATRRRSQRNIHRSTSKDGQIMKMEKMLVRVDWSQQQIPDDYDENDSQKVESRTVDKWRELMVVCRGATGDNEPGFKLQFYKTRVIPAVETQHVRKRPHYTVPLDPKTVGVNLFSSLDKTVVMWKPEKRGNRIFIMQPQSGSDSMEWYTFLRNIGGWYRSNTLQVTVPDLSVQLLICNPFDKLEASRDIAQAADGDDAALAKTLEEEEAIARHIIERCVAMLKNSPQWGPVIDQWAQNQHIGLAWKRYDRLEWVHGANERKMYGTIAMQHSHDLELRPKQHYPTSVRDSKEELLQEPSPVEGFLIRLTSQKGRDQRLGRMFFKRLYFSTHGEFLVYSRPAKVSPPPPPKLPMRSNTKVPSAHEIADQTPLIYAIKPYDIDQAGGISWLSPHYGQTSSEIQQHDREAQDEADRNTETLRNCDGIIKLSNIERVRNVVRGAVPADDRVDDGSDVEFHVSVDDTPRDDGETGQFDDDRTFELVLRNGLMVRLQAYDTTTKNEWKRRLRALIKYWTIRSAADLQLYKEVRRTNFKALKIDEESEAYVGQFAKKWEVGKSTASPELYHLCGISLCRTVLMSGVLFRKPRLHSVFSRCTVILCPGQLLIFQDAARTRSGREERQIQHDRIGAIDLQGCYLYSGLVTENDLLYQNRTFDANKPGHGALPRRYADGWTSSDGDTACCFVIWHGKKKNLFRAPGDTGESKGKPGSEQQKQRFKLVSSLGVPGRSIVFKTRSRAEKDHWVMSIAGEIERLHSGEDVRLVEGKDTK
ncbi:MAG: hypothetical protein M1820_008457 [Bogoriella megaspora]|nr:MAG: hypothetical protein M1820_008457 [Bogoriella megaspora]